MQLFIGIIIGMIVMDFLWAWRLGIPQMLFRLRMERYRRWRERRNG